MIEYLNRETVMKELDRNSAIYDCDFISGLFFDDDFCSRGERERKKG